MKTLRVILLVLLPVYFFVSCSNSDDANDTKNYFPMTIGKYYIYSIYSLDQSSKKTGNERVDSVYVSEKTLKDNKECYVYKYYTTDSMGVKRFTRDDYYYSENDKLYVSSDYFNGFNIEGYPIPLKLKNSWYLIADNKQSKWLLDSISLPDSLEITAYKITILKPYLLINGSKGENKNLTILSNTYNNSQEFVITFEIHGTIKEFPIPLTIPIENSMWYAPDIGLVQHIRKPSSIALTNFKIPGEDRSLKLYK